MNARKTLRDDRTHIEEPRRHGRMLTAAAFAIVLIADDDRSDALRLVRTGDLRNREVRFAGQDVRALARLGGKGAVGAEKHVVADLVQMAAELEPRTGR